jgi:channel protein (hemolysin III family)
MDAIEAAPIPGVREPVNCFTHLLAALAFSILSVYFIRRGRGNWIRTTSLAVMAFSSVFQLSMSAVYHLLGAGPGRDLMRQMDIAGVFVLIAGSMTPVHAILDAGMMRWASLLVVWVAALMGITLTTVFSASLPISVIIGIFLLFGWGGLISFIRLWRRYGIAFVTPLLWGGVAYSLGAIALGMNWPRPVPRVVGAHEVWHLAVVLGLGLHWRFVFQFAHGAPDTPSPASLGSDSPPESD